MISAFSMVPASAATFVHLIADGNQDLSSGDTFNGMTNFQNDTNATAISPYTAAWDYTDDIFSDGTYIYRTNSDGGTTSVTKYDSLVNMATGTGGVTTPFSQTWSYDDEFFSDGTYFYRTGTNGTTHVNLARYASYSDLTSNNVDQTFEFSTQFSKDDEFFSDGTNYYRTDSAGVTPSFAVYPTFTDLLNHQNYTTYDFYSDYEPISWPLEDQFLAIPVPEPATLALLAGGTAVLRLKRKRK